MTDAWQDFIARVAGGLSDMEKQGDSASWAKARLVIDGWNEAMSRPELHNLRPRQRSKKFYDDLRAWWRQSGEPETRPSFMANARKLFSLWPEVVSFETNNPLPYQHYRQMSVCALPPDQKRELRTWAEEHRPKQAQLRQEIRVRVDALAGVYKPDFELKVSNHWVFQVDNKRSDGFHGGVNAEIYANLIHSFSDPGDTIIDPFAGGGLLEDTLLQFRHFREFTKAEHSGPRRALMCDISPTRNSIVAADARKAIPFDTECADLAILDPPYYGVANGKYDNIGDSTLKWLDGLRSVLIEVKRCLKHSGIVAIMTDDWIRKQSHEPMGLHILELLCSIGFKPIMTIYNFNRNFTGMSGGDMARAKSNRLHVNAVKIIQVAEIVLH